MQSGKGTLLAIDIGTTTTRCVLFDLDGVPLAQAYREPRVCYPKPNWAEVAPEDWWTAVVAVVREVLQRRNLFAENILGIGLCGLKHAIVPVGADGMPLANAMLWMDQRCQPQAAWMVREHNEIVQRVIGTGRITRRLVADLDTR